MLDISAFYILGLPIQTEIGECRFIKVREYPDFFSDLQIASFSKDQIIFKYSEINKNGKLDNDIATMKNLPLYQIILRFPEFSNAYFKLFTKVFDGEETLSLITEENFDYYRSLILKMNCQKEEKINPNPEIQRALERSRRVKSQDSDGLEFADIVSSVVGYNGLSYYDINEFTIYQLYMTFYRISSIKSYDTNTLYQTVSHEKMKIENWSKHINLFEEENHSITKEEMKNKSNSLFGK